MKHIKNKKISYLIYTHTYLVFFFLLSALFLNSIKNINLLSKFMIIPYCMGSATLFFSSLGYNPFSNFLQAEQCHQLFYLIGRTVA